MVSPDELRRLRAAGDAKGVLRAIEGEADVGPENPETARIVAWAHSAESHPGKAFEILSRARALFPLDVGVLVDFGHAAIQMGRWNEAAETFGMLFQSTAHAGQTAGAPGAGQAAQRAAVFPVAARGLVLSWAAMGRHDEAAKLIGMLPARGAWPPQLAQAFEDCFDSAAKAGKAGLAAAGVEALVGHGGDDLALGLKAAQFRLDAGEPERAKELVGKVLEARPEHVLGRLVARQADRALTAKRIAELRILIDLPTQRYSGGGIPYMAEDSLRLGPPSPAFIEAMENRADVIENELKVALGRYLLAAGEYEEALRTVQSIALPEPFLRVEVAALKGMLWHRRGFPDLALVELQQVGAQALASGDLGEALDLLASLQEESGHAQEALRTARRGARLRKGPRQTERIRRLEARLRTQIEDVPDGVPVARPVGPPAQAGAAPSQPAGDPADAGSSRAADEALVGSTIDGTYEVQTVVGRGGMGVVLRVLNTNLQRSEALKLLPEHSQSDPSAAERLVREARVVASLVHPNIVRVFATGVYRGRPYLTMELLDGQTLTALMRSHGRLDLERIVQVASQMADGLRFAHVNGIVHRDVKPDNVMILSGSGGVKLMDFGLAADLGSSSGFRRESFMGTIHYISPEQINGQEVDQRTDIYSFGVVLYEMLTGQAPFDSPNPHNLMFMHLTRTPPSPRVLRPDTPDDLERLVHRCLEKSPARRPSDFGEVARDLRKISS